MTTIYEKIIAIVGGGPGGLTLARLLQLRGIHVKVYERDINRNVRVQGATLDLHQESGLKALKAAGLIDAFKASYRPGADKFTLIDQYGTIRFEDGENENSFSDNEHFRPEIDRGPLRDLLLDSLHPDTVVWDSQFVSLEKKNSGMLLHFADGRSAYADIVIAADGANSRIRRYLTDAEPFYTGIMIVKGAIDDAINRVPQITRLLEGGKIFATCGTKTLVISAKGDGSLQFYAGFRAEENWAKSSGINFTDNASVLKWFNYEFDDCCELWSNLFKHATLPFIPRPQYCMPVEHAWEAQANLTMLGDAAHVMPPYAGEGVNMAMLDALELSECLLNKEFDSMKQAIAAYEDKMCRRISAVAKETMEQTAILHSPEGLAHLTEIFAGQH
ncbi:FAD-dependent monooxygenase [Mucilaginibacter sp. RS28]|uniref:Flavin-dependent monooxygenase n=1 Tax=Mucilaginibacter straminoryzae TaxID=2932774 RepID=A0A9X1X6A2_9SPHI|nr:NAD(P)/FAD-dependent oxidoreductase [Mucilaginibacter straminoryzae]MCJ8211115.1 FAD-dependent monooxygenase [Mucilaginibacter straminoryzae]